jgi:hypothetical protein
MPKYVLIAMNGPIPGGDADELENWYREIHIPDLLSVDGIKAARRFKTVRGLVKTGDLWPDVTIFEIETDDLDKVSKGMQTQLRPFHPLFDKTRSAHIFALQTMDEEET